MLRRPLETTPRKRTSDLRAATSRRRISRTINQSLKCDGSSGGLHSSSGSPMLPTSTTNGCQGCSFSSLCSSRATSRNASSSSEKPWWSILQHCLHSSRARWLMLRPGPSNGVRLRLRRCRRRAGPCRAGCRAPVPHPVNQAGPGRPEPALEGRGANQAPADAAGRGQPLRGRPCSLNVAARYGVTRAWLAAAPA